jgi:hypothetical protein
MLFRMNEQPHLSEALIREITRYLAAVDLFRAEQCEPTWLPELARSAPPQIRRSAKRETRSSA